MLRFEAAIEFGRDRLLGLGGRPCDLEDGLQQVPLWLRQCPLETLEFRAEIVELLVADARHETPSDSVTVHCVLGLTSRAPRPLRDGRGARGSRGTAATRRARTR